jgi:hypothetical protein
MRIPILLMCAIGALVLPGCGSSSDDSGATAGGGESLSKSEFIAQADQVCESAREEAKSLEAQLGDLAKAKNSKEFNEFADVVRQLTDQVTSEIAELRELAPPFVDSGAVENFLSLIEERAVTGEEFANALEDGNQANASSLSEKASATNAKAAAIAKELGFKVCGAGGSEGKQSGGAKSASSSSG